MLKKYLPYYTESLMSQHRYLNKAAFYLYLNRDYRYKTLTRSRRLGELVFLNLYD